MTSLAFREDWRSRAACAVGTSSTFHKSYPVPAKEVCGRCPVRPECLYDAVATKAPTGVWGGLTREERKLLPVLPTDRAKALGVLRDVLDATDAAAVEEHDAQHSTVVPGPAPAAPPRAEAKPREAPSTAALPPAAEAPPAPAAEATQPTDRSAQARPNGGRHTPEQRAVIARRTVQMLRAGASYSEITAELGISSPTIVRIRRRAGLPHSGRTGAPPARSKAEVLALHVELYSDGHARWTGPMAGRMAQLHAEQDRFNARRVVFEEHHGRPPVGRVRSNCGEQACIAGAHLIDRVLRDAQHPAVAGHSTALSEGNSPAVTTTPSAPPLPTKDLIKWAEEHADSSVQALAARVREGLTDLRLRYEADHELTAIASKKEELEAQLAALTAREAELSPRKKRKAGAYVRDYDTRTVRAWAAENGVDCPGRGQIPKHVLDAWRAAVSSATAGTP
ncbi:WhiB family transcriptional regulator [Streptomyces parvulus]|uniref:WhiB family transcriptional regulator n=1 Tax=Streptomyces parvulus TaxID=146923 RepID=UPI0033B1CE93